MYNNSRELLHNHAEFVGIIKIWSKSLKLLLNLENVWVWNIHSEYLFKLFILFHLFLLGLLYTALIDCTAIDLFKIFLFHITLIISGNIELIDHFNKLIHLKFIIRNVVEILLFYLTVISWLNWIILFLNIWIDLAKWNVKS